MVANATLVSAATYPIALSTRTVVRVRDFPRRNKLWGSVPDIQQGIDPFCDIHGAIDRVRGNLHVSLATRNTLRPPRISSDARGAPPNDRSSLCAATPP